MTAVTRSDLNSGVLQTWLDRKTLENLRDELFFYKFGLKPTLGDGYNTIGWPRFTKLTSSSVTTGTTSTDGVTPADTAFNATVVTATPTQYRVVVSISDVVQENNVIDFVSGAAMEVGNAMAEKVDEVIQTEVMAGTNVLYGGNATSRVTVDSTDLLTAAMIRKAGTYLKNKAAKTIGGMYVGMAHPFQMYDLRSETATGTWIDSTKYAQPDRIFKGEIGALFGVRMIENNHIQAFAGEGASGIDVYPALFLGEGAYGVADFQSLQVKFVPATPSDSDPLAQRRKVGAKVMFAVKRLQEDAMLRIETAATDVTA